MSFESTITMKSEGILTNAAALDPVAQIPEYKICAVSLSKLS
ncbi:MAG: hypothetical protein PVG39_05715 [Desulfobacteraceae bacterium]|jgi:hypothetical protein